MARAADGRGPYLPYHQKNSSAISPGGSKKKSKKPPLLGMERRKTHLPPRISYRNQGEIMKQIFGSHQMQPRKMQNVVTHKAPRF
jgi:hypothetical protein